MMKVGMTVEYSVYYLVAMKAAGSADWWVVLSVVSSAMRTVGTWVELMAE